MDENERQRSYYNKKLIKQSFSNELKKSHKIRARDLILTIIGSFIAMAVIDLIEIERLTRNNVAVFILEAVIIALSIQIVFLIAGKIIPVKDKDDISDTQI